MHLKELSLRIQQLVDQSNHVLSTRYEESGEFSPVFVDSTKFYGLRASVLSFIAMVYGKDHSHYSEFNGAASDSYESDIKKGHGILLAIQDEIDNGWIFSVKN